VGALGSRVGHEGDYAQASVMARPYTGADATGAFDGLPHELHAICGRVGEFEVETAAVVQLVLASAVLRVTDGCIGEWFGFLAMR
jgi:hypothetical protein